MNALHVEYDRKRQKYEVRIDAVKISTLHHRIEIPY